MSRQGDKPAHSPGNRQAIRKKKYEQRLPALRISYKRGSVSALLGGGGALLHPNPGR